MSRYVRETSAVSEHCQATGHNINSHNVNILSEENYTIKRRIKEAAIAQGHPTVIFGKISVRKTIWELEFSNICCKISCLPAPPRIFEHLQNAIITHFQRIFTLKKAT